MKLFVTGAAGFIGSNYVRHVLDTTDHSVTIYDSLTYAGNLESIRDVLDDTRCEFVHADICDADDVTSAMDGHDAVVHFAAESHVDRSIQDGSGFVRTNCMGTNVLCDVANTVGVGTFLHISTDEVYGALGADGVFTEDTPYDPSSPYSASKAASDHLAMAWHRTYGLPVVLSNCSNNYGPYQFPEKLIPLIIASALNGKVLPVYGRGDNVRDWLYVDDHARALLTLLESGRPGERYNIGSRSERTNLQVVRAICDCLDRDKPRADGDCYSDTIGFVTDRLGHDFRYAIDPQKIETELNWRAEEDFQSGIDRTVKWYLANEAWWRQILDNVYDGARLGLEDRKATAGATH